MLTPYGNTSGKSFLTLLWKLFRVRDCTVLQLTAAGISFVIFMTVNLDYSKAWIPHQGSVLRCTRLKKKKSALKSLQYYKNIRHLLHSKT